MKFIYFSGRSNSIVQLFATRLPDCNNYDTRGGITLPVHYYDGWSNISMSRCISMNAMSIGLGAAPNRKQNLITWSIHLDHYSNCPKTVSKLGHGLGLFITGNTVQQHFTRHFESTLIYPSLHSLNMYFLHWICKTTVFQGQRNWQHWTRFSYIFA